ncbi:hypothetical protein ZWY2020_044114 [Hordeum vulgare]|nr:hypothetical protein ZWY2020_044114 [Hordeum vulgare]
MAPPRPPPRRPLTLVDKRIASIQNLWVARVQNSGRDLASVLRVSSPICCRAPQGPANAASAVPAPPPVPGLVVLGSETAPSMEPPLLGTPFCRRANATHHWLFILQAPLILVILPDKTRFNGPAAIVSPEDDS